MAPIEEYRYSWVDSVTVSNAPGYGTWVIRNFVADNHSDASSNLCVAGESKEWDD